MKSTSLRRRSLLALTLAAAALQASPAAADVITIGSSPYAFVRESNGSLALNYLNGSSWSWLNRDYPSSSVTVASVVGSTTAGGNPYTFIQGSDGNLWQSVSTGSSWFWSDLGSPSTSVTVAGSVGVVTTSGAPYAFVQGSDDKLYLNWWNPTSSTWSWANQGSPSSTVTVAGGVGVILTTGGAPYAFVQGSDGDLYLNWWNPTSSTWSWANQGSPSSTVTVVGGVGVVNNGQGYAYAFVQGSDGNLWLNYWNGSSWGWWNAGSPSSGVTVAGAVGATTVGGSPYIFVRGSDGKLYLKWWNPTSSSWNWANEGSPSSSVTVASGVGVTTANNASYAFVQGSDGNLWQNYWNGSSWIWANQGQPSYSASVAISDAWSTSASTGTGDLAFGAGFSLSVRASAVDANLLPGHSGYLTGANGSLDVPVTLFGQNIDLLTATGDASMLCDLKEPGWSSPVSQTLVLGQLTVAGAQVASFSTSVSTAQIDETPFNQSLTFLSADYEIEVAGIPVYVEASASGSVSISVQGTASFSASSPSLSATLTPSASIDASLGVGVGNPDVVSVGLEGDLTIVDIDAPLVFSAQPAATEVTLSESGTATATGLNGSASLNVSVIGDTVYSQQLFSWSGISYANTSLFDDSQTYSW